jgi:hypothetical protein
MPASEKRKSGQKKVRKEPYVWVRAGSCTDACVNQPAVPCMHVESKDQIPTQRQTRISTTIPLLPHVQPQPQHEVRRVRLRVSGLG